MASPKVDSAPVPEDDFDDDDFYSSPAKKDAAPQDSSSITLESPAPTSATLTPTVPGLDMKSFSSLEATLASENSSIGVDAGQMHIVTDTAISEGKASVHDEEERAVPDAINLEQKEIPLNFEAAQIDPDVAIDAPIVKAGLDPEFLQAAEENKDKKDAEWRFDSSDAESSDSSESDSSDDSSSEDDSSDDNSDDSEDNSDGNDVLLTPAEQARILMEGIEEGPSTAAPLRTHNEQPDEFQPKPTLDITPEMKITELGDVQSVIDHYILVTAKTSGEYMVLEHGSVLCLQDRTVLGVVHETIGQVQSPIYMIGYNTIQEAKETGVTKGTKVFYVDDHSTYVFTEKIRAHKGTDASNIFDEPLPEEEMEFSDDEQEQAFRRKRKADKKAQSQSQWEAQNGIIPSNSSRSQRSTGIAANSSQQTAYPSTIRYDDDDADDDQGMYRPLTRPDNLHEMMAYGAPEEGLPRSITNGRGRGRGDRQWVDRGRGARGRTGRGRGNVAGGYSQRPDHARRGRGDHRGQDQRSPLPARPEQSAPPQPSPYSFVPPLVNGVPPPPPIGMPFSFGQQGMPTFTMPPPVPGGVNQNSFQNGNNPAQLPPMPPNFAQAFATFQQQFNQLSQQFSQAPLPPHFQSPPQWSQPPMPSLVAPHAWSSMQMQQPVQQQAQQQGSQQAGPSNAQLEELLRMINANKPKE
ncbi:hypothetical protein FKW77_009592 [Venturia effusa]|uniref:H/ACA ribonucleoprotein complex non-core subunit NAF1 n=1 Tax=Venturia effusa TaxID=50376 RepID=A0A517L859_9PEZI|nr:hypothetical protein FKW77_009592 [Venturia effusa]